jgi:hypothetical protein
MCGWNCYTILHSAFGPSAPSGEVRIRPDAAIAQPAVKREAYRKKDDPKVPLQLLIFAMQAGLTTLTCIAEYLGWENFTVEQKCWLGTLYVPYLALCKLTSTFE